MKNIKQVEMGALYLDGAAQLNPASDYMAGTIPLYQHGAKITIGESPADHPECAITWNVVTFPDGKRLLISDHALLVDVSYDDLEAAGFVEGQKVTLDGKRYLCRLLRCDNSNKDADEWDNSLDATNDSDALWHWWYMPSWASGSAPDAAYRVYRGAYSARYFGWNLSGYRNTSVGFRPVLVPLHNDNLIFKVEGKPKAEHLHLEDGRVMCGDKCGARIGGMEVFTRDDAERAYKLFISRCWHNLSLETSIAVKNESQKMQELGYSLEEIESMEISAIVKANLLPDTQGEEKE